MKRIFLVVYIIGIINSFVYAQDFSYKEKKELKGYPEYILDAKFSPFRNYFALTIGNNTIEIYNKDWKTL